MAKLSSFQDMQDRLQDIGSRLRKENESRDRLDFSRGRPGSERRPRPCMFRLLSPSGGFIFYFINKRPIILHFLSLIFHLRDILRKTSIHYYNNKKLLL